MTEQTEQTAAPTEGAGPFQQAPSGLAAAATGPTMRAGSQPSAIDLDSKRRQRAAAREGAREPLPIRLGGQVIATLPVELPLTALEPLRGLDSDLTLILRYAMDAQRAQRGGDRAEALGAGDMVVNILASNPNLPVSVLDTFRDVACNLLTVEGFAALMAERPSAEDLAALASGVMEFYGVTLGESSAPSGSPEGSGTTSSTTSESTSGSTPETSTPTPGPVASSESVAS